MSMREVSGAFAATLRHLPGDTSLAEALQALGWQMPTAARTLTRAPVAGAGATFLVWRNPQEVLALCAQEGAGIHPFEQLIGAFAGGRSTSAIAADMSHALALMELNGPDVQKLLPRVVDAASIPAPGAASGARLGDIPVLLVRPDAARAWLVFERPWRPYMNDWLAYASGGADVETA